MNWLKSMGIAMAFGAVCVGCASMALKSDNAAERMAAVKEITDQSDLLDIAQNKEYQNDIRLDAIKRLKNQRNLWRIWCENGENKAISDASLKLLTDEMLLARVALLHSYEESSEEKEARQSSETKKAWGVGLAAAAVNVGGAAAASKAGGAGGALAASAGTAAANIGLAAALSKESRPTPSMSIRTNDALIAVSRIKSEGVVSNVAMNSTISCIHLQAFRKFLEMTDCMDVLKYAVIRGEMKEARTDSRSADDLRRNRIIAIRKIFDVKTLQDILREGDDAATHLAFARMIQLNQYEAAVDALCEYSPRELLHVEIQGSDNDVSEDSATKLVGRIEGKDLFEKLALKSRSLMIAKAAVRKITDGADLVRIAEKMEYGRSNVAKTAIDQISVVAAVRLIESGAVKDNEYIEVCLARKVSDRNAVLSLFAKCQHQKTRMVFAKKLDPQDITADLYEAEKQGEIKRALLDRAPEEVKAEIAARRRPKILKMIAAAERDAKELALLFSKTGMNFDQAKAVTRKYCGRALYFKDATVWNNNISTNDKTMKRVLFSVSYRNGSSINFYGDFAGDFKAAAKKLEGFKKASVFGVVTSEESHCFYLNGLVVTEDNKDGIESLIDSVGMPDTMLDEMISDKDSITRRFAKEEDLDFPEVETEKSTSTLQDSLKTVGVVKEGLDTAKEVKQKASNAWADLKSQVKKGMVDTVGK